MAGSAAVKKTIKNMLGGVSQQPPLQRLESQCEDMTNCIPSLTEFLKRRSGVRFITDLEKTLAADKNIFVDFIIRGDNDAGIVTVDKIGNVTVYNLNGVKIGQTQDGYLVSSSPKDDIKLCTVRDYNFLVNTKKTVVEEKYEDNTDNIECLVVIKQASYDQQYTLDISGTKITYSTPMTNTNGFILSAERIAIELTRNYETNGGAVNEEIIWDHAYEAGNGEGHRLGYVVFSSEYKGAIFTSANLSPALWYYYIGARIVKGKTTAQPLGFYEGNLFTGDSLTPISFYYYNEEDLKRAGNDTTIIQKGQAECVRNVIWFNGINSVKVGIETDDAYLSVIKSEVATISELPIIAPDKYYIKVLGDVTNDSDDYYIEFETEDGKSFSKGGWKEVAAKDSRYKLDPDTMPVALTIVDNNSIKVETIDWKGRLAGDKETNPSPSFVGKTIKDMFFYNNRLGFITDDSIVMSEAGEYFNFYQTTALALLDSDPIDVAISGTKVSALKYAVPYAEGLFLYSDRSLYVLEYGDVLSTANVELKPILQFDTSLSTEPVVCDTSIYYVGNKGSYNQIREYKPTDQSDQYGYSNDITSHIPKYITGNVRKMCISLEDGIMFLINETSEVFCYSFIKDSGELLLSSWHKWTFPHNVIMGSLFGGWLYLVFKKDDNSLYLGKVAVSDVDTLYSDEVAKGSYLEYVSSYTYSPYYLRDSQGRVQDISTMIRTMTLKYSSGSEFKIIIDRKARKQEIRYTDKRRDFTRFLAASENKDIKVKIESVDDKPFNIIETDLEVIYAGRS